VIKGGRLSAARARNAGWQAASGHLILFLDGDTILHPDFPAQALVAFDDPNVVVVWGHRREIHPGASLYNRVLDLDWICLPGPAEFCGGDALMKRDALEKIGGFNPQLIAGEEPDLCRRLRAAGGLIQHIDSPMTGHDLAMVSWSQYWRRAVRAGHAYAEIAGLYKETEDRLWAAASRQNVIQVTAYTLFVLAAVAGSITSRSAAWIVLFLAGALVVVLRTAYKAKWKSDSALTMFLFGIHSHLQQFPIFFGQIRYWFNAKRKWRTELIEYKKPL
jgi:cellulose synthase/poly-beta-1,6-N-acetylglucosamine synthase-like glycosyltransferase